jgi:hypothetical protein
MKPLTLLATVALLLSGCTHQYRAFDIYFWSSAPAGKSYHLYLNRHYAGEVPALGQPPLHLQEETLHRHLPSGHYRVELTDDQGKVVYRERLTVLWSTRDKSIGTEIRDTLGRSNVVIRGNTLVEEFHVKDAQGPA